MWFLKIVPVVLRFRGGLGRGGGEIQVWVFLFNRRRGLVDSGNLVRLWLTGFRRLNFGFNGCLRSAFTH